MSQAESNPEGDKRKRLSILETLISIYQGEGVGGFFKGIRAKILQSILAGAILLMIKEQLYDATAASLRRLAPSEQANAASPHKEL